MITIAEEKCIAISQIQHLILFLLLSPIHSLEDTLDVFKMVGTPIRSRQKALREQQVIDLLLPMLQTPFTEYGGTYTSLKRLASNGKYINND